MPATVVVGAQWGDEGKGKIVDLLTPNAHAVVRYAGGANAGHTLVIEGAKHVLHLVPSGVMHPEKQNVIGPGTVIDPGSLIDELDALERGGISTRNVFVSERAHVVLPHHRTIDALREKADGKIGTTKRGIGPAYEDKVGRCGLRMRDLVADDLAPRVAENVESWGPELAALGGDAVDVDALVAQLRAWGERIAPMLRDTSPMLAAALGRGEQLLLEGAQGTMLDVDHGTYPFVTSSNPTAGGACVGAGIGPTAVDRVIGITKAYTTRVGGGPFVTELEDAVGEKLRADGAEFGATTGRPRRCGWLDMVALRYAVEVNGMTTIALTKLDVLTGHATLRIATAYTDATGARLERPSDWAGPFTPEYEELPGWTEDITGARRLQDLPANARRYIDRIAELAACPVDMVSVGPDRDATIA